MELVITFSRNFTVLYYPIHSNTVFHAPSVLSMVLNCFHSDLLAVTANEISLVTGLCWSVCMMPTKPGISPYTLRKRILWILCFSDKTSKQRL